MWNNPINGEDLLTIKNKRNHLAHGNFSFAEIGKDYTTGDLNAFSKSTYLFLLDVIDQYQRFIDEIKIYKFMKKILFVLMLCFIIGLYA